jgi:hypothetical protein
MGTTMGARRAGTLSVFLVAVLTACASPAASPGSPTDGGAGGDGTGGNGGVPGTDLTACELVTPADIEAALQLDPGTVSEGQTGELAGDDPAANECSYVAQAWGSLVVQVVPTDGVNIFDIYVSGSGADAEALDIGDGALWLKGVERGHFLKGSVLVTIVFLRLTEPMPFREPTIDLGEAALAKL